MGQRLRWENVSRTNTMNELQICGTSNQQFERKDLWCGLKNLRSALQAISYIFNKRDVEN